MVEELVSDERENDENIVGTAISNFADDEENPHNSNPKRTTSTRGLINKMFISSQLYWCLQSKNFFNKSC